MFYQSNKLFLVSFLCIIPAVITTTLFFFWKQRKNTGLEGCKKLGISIGSNLSGEHDVRYSKGTSKPIVSGSGTSNWKVKSLWIFPVKSCRGVELSKGNIVSTGMQYDRSFAFAQLLGTFPAKSGMSDSEKSDGKWKFLTQRERPQMARVRTEIWIPDPSSLTYSPNHPNIQSEGVLVLKFPIEEGYWGRLSELSVRLGGKYFERSLHLPFRPTPQQIKVNGYTTEIMTIWKDSPQSLLMANTVPDSTPNTIFKELSRFLGISNSLGLFRVPSSNPVRDVYRCAPRKEELGYQSQVGFQDAYPLHIMNLASVRDVEKRLAATEFSPPSKLISTLRFRPNIIITGPDVYAEDDWKRIKIGEFEYHVCCRTARCRLPNVDPITGVRDAVEPYKLLRSYRAIDEGAGLNACLGMQMVPASVESVVSVGDSIELLETGEHFYIKQ